MRASELRALALAWSWSGMCLVRFWLDRLFAHLSAIFHTGICRVGKTSLVDQIKKTIEKRKGYVIRGKFSLMEDRSRPDSILFEALDSFLGTIAYEAAPDLRDKVRRRIVNAVSYGMGRPSESIISSKILSNSIPNLGELLGRGFRPGHDLAHAHLNQEQLLQRSTFLLCKLIGAIADATMPIALVFDDLQWCDHTSLSVIQAIATDPGKWI